MIRYLALLLPIAAGAAEPPYQAAGVFPGMGAAAAKAAGVEICNQYDHETVVCRPKQRPATYLDLPVTDYFVKFYKPYDRVSGVVIKVGTLVSKSKECKPPTQGKWAGLIAVGCATSAADALQSAYGPGFLGGIWHKCGLETIELKGDTITLSRAPEEWKVRRAQECEQAKRQTDAGLQRQTEQATFIKSMK